MAGHWSGYITYHMAGDDAGRIRHMRWVGCRDRAHAFALNLLSMPTIDGVHLFSENLSYGIEVLK